MTPALARLAVNDWIDVVPLRGVGDAAGVDRDGRAGLEDEEVGVARRLRQRLLRPGGGTLAGIRAPAWSWLAATSNQADPVAAATTRSLPVVLPEPDLALQVDERVLAEDQVVVVGEDGRVLADDPLERDLAVEGAGGDVVDEHLVHEHLAGEPLAASG